ncbi:hypothetical protein L1049_017184 [Liquidambar formosana]|uniref:Gnk2-homologous domain-containing protein n=1 Tax=Liquidambar formosana TaxID=63359 RepID=A0AAP0S788_LIQFO
MNLQRISSTMPSKVSHKPPHEMVSAFLALALLATISLATVTAAANDNASTELRRTCSATLASNPQSFESNFVNALQILSPEVANTGFGIADVARDDPSARVYSLAQCFNYLPNKECRLCFRNLGVKLTNCLTATSARLYLNGCFLRYAGYNFSQEAVDSSSDTSVCKSSGNVSDTVKFRETTNGLIQNLTLGAYENRDYYKEGMLQYHQMLKFMGLHSVGEL